jgi:hypothetical protein
MVVDCKLESKWSARGPPEDPPPVAHGPVKLSSQGNLNDHMKLNAEREDIRSVPKCLIHPSCTRTIIHFQ